VGTPTIVGNFCPNCSTLSMFDIVRCNTNHFHNTNHAPSFSCSSKTRKSILEELLDQGKGKSVFCGLPGASDKNTSDVPMTAFSSIYQSGLLSAAPGTQIPSASTYAPIQVLIISL
jgi:hypothetical protein